jgi:nucleolar complex protein 3
MLLDNDIKYSYILRKFIIVSLCEVFKDIVPSYKIRTWTEKENQQKVTNFYLN